MMTSMLHMSPPMLVLAGEIVEAETEAPYRLWALGDSNREGDGGSGMGDRQ